MNNNYTISSNHNALVAGPLTIASGATLTINYCTFSGTVSDVDNFMNRFSANTEL